MQSFSLDVAQLTKQLSDLQQQCLGWDQATSTPKVGGFDGFSCFLLMFWEKNGGGLVKSFGYFGSKLAKNGLEMFRGHFWGSAAAASIFNAVSLPP